jgi:antitoxin VapB
MMAIFIKRAVTEDKIRELATRTGETITEAVDRAVDERLAKLGACRATGRVDWTRLEVLIAKVKAAPALNQGMLDDEIVGYNEHGVPR